MQAAKCLELRISADCIGEEDFAALAESFHTLGLSLETDAASGISTHVAWFGVEDDEPLQKARLSAAARLAGIPAQAISIRELAEQDWTTAWQQDWHGQNIGDALWVRPSFCPPPPAGLVDIVLDPGMAFGTGTHPTTRLCLAAIERICRRQAPASLLDMGAGSGILAIAALKLGVASALAIDMEADAVAACRSNASINGVDMRVEAGDRPPGQRFDLVVANILAGPLIDMAPSLAGCVGDTLILSGLLDEQTDMVCAPYLKEGLSVERTDSENGWAAIALRRP